MTNTDRQLRTLQGELTELKQQHIQVQQQSEKQQQELLKLAQRLEVLRKSKGHFEAKATRTALVSRGGFCAPPFPEQNDNGIDAAEVPKAGTA